MPSGRQNMLSGRLNMASGRLNMLFPKGSLWGGKAKHALPTPKVPGSPVDLWRIPSPKGCPWHGKGPKDSLGGSLWGGKAKHALPEGTPLGKGPLWGGKAKHSLGKTKHGLRKAKHRLGKTQNQVED